jgi:hypothetical protein
VEAPWDVTGDVMQTGRPNAVLDSDAKRGTNRHARNAVVAECGQPHAVPSADFHHRREFAMARLSLPRRYFLQGTLGAFAGLLAGVRPHLGLAAKKPKSLTLYQLSPIYNSAGAEYCGGCSSCNACIKHAENKLFATSAAADNGRAHPNCDCAIVHQQVKYSSWVALFGSPSNPRHLSRDRRERRSLFKQLVP